MSSTFEQWKLHMQKGDFEAAWRVSDIQMRQNRRNPCRHLPRHLQYIWDGSPLKNKNVLIRCYHGLGDTIQFIRYLPLVEKIAAKTSVFIQPNLIPLVETMRSKSQILPLNDGEPQISYDLDVELMELPFVFRTTFQSIPCNVPYFFINVEAQKRISNLSVGVVWDSGDWDAKRSIPFSLMEKLMKMPGMDFHIIQRGPALSQVNGIGIPSGSDDIFTAARILKSLDLLISVDTMPAHLAGALGVRTWTLLQYDADWRWMKNCHDSPWYPTMRLFRQNEPGKWDKVIEQVSAELVILRDKKKPLA